MTEKNISQLKGKQKRKCGGGDTHQKHVRAGLTGSRDLVDSRFSTLLLDRNNLAL